MGWTKGPYEHRNNFKILVRKPFGKPSFGRRGEDGRLLRNTDLRVSVWWKRSVQPSMRADRLLGCTTRIAVNYLLITKPTRCTNFTNLF